MMKRAKNQEVKATKKPPYQIDRHKFFDTEERNRLMDHTQKRAEEDEFKGRKTWVDRWMLVHLAMYTGLRVSEISALEIRDVHLEKKEPYIHIRHGKGGKPRDVYIDNGLVEHLRKFIHRSAVLTPDNKRLFPRTTTALHIAFKQSIRSASLRSDLSIHNARHTYATLLLHRTHNIKYVQKQLGHSSMNMTALYADILPEENGRLANMILYDEPETKTQTS